MSESDWKVLKDALDMWGSTQVAIRGHVQTVSEAVDRLYDLRKRDSELILRLAKERNDAREREARLEGLLEATELPMTKQIEWREAAEARVKELEADLEECRETRRTAVDKALLIFEREGRLVTRVAELEQALRHIKVWAEQELRDGPPELGLIVGEASRALGT